MILPMENTERMIFPGVGKYGIPEIKPETDIRIDKLEWIPVNYALTAKDKATKGVHFYKDDYQFERFWNNPDKYIPLLQQFGAVCSPHRENNHPTARRHVTASAPGHARGTVGDAGGGTRHGGLVHRGRCVDCRQ